MNHEMQEFAISEAVRMKDVVAEELFRRAEKIDIDVVNNSYEGIYFWFTFAGATVWTSWNCDDRFDNPDVVYGILLQLIYQAEDNPSPRKSAPTEESQSEEPMAFLWGDMDQMDPDEDEDLVPGGPDGFMKL